MNNPDQQIPRVVELSGRLDAASLQDKKKELMEHLTAERSHLVVNLREVSFIDSTGLGFLVSIGKIQETSGFEMVFCEVPEQARLLFELTRLNQIFDLFDTQSTAVSALAA